MCVDGVGKAHVEGVVVLHQRGLLVVEHQLLQAAVEVKGLGEAEALRRAEHHAVLHLAVHAGDRQDRDRDRSGHMSASTNHRAAETQLGVGVWSTHTTEQA